MTGLSLSQFGRLVAEIGPVWAAEREQRLSRRQRQRAFGAGRTHQLPFAGRLLVTLMYLRWNVTYRCLAAVFDTDKDTVNRAVAELTPLVARVGITGPDGARIGDNDALAARLDALSHAQRAALVDGSFVPIPRPSTGWAAQKAQYAPHRHRHVNTFQILTDDHGNLLWVGAAQPGATHDLTAICHSDAADALTHSDIVVIADRAYLGIGRRLGIRALTPIRRTDAKHMTDQDRADHNHALERRRVRVEHAARRIKLRRILTDYRRRLAHLTDTIHACAALATMPT